MIVDKKETISAFANQRLEMISRPKLIWRKKNLIFLKYIAILHYET